MFACTRTRGVARWFVYQRHFRVSCSFSALCANFALGATDAKCVDEEQPPISAVISNKSYLFLTFWRHFSLLYQLLSVFCVCNAEVGYLPFLPAVLRRVKISQGVTSVSTNLLFQEECITFGEFLEGGEANQWSLREVFCYWPRSSYAHNSVGFTVDKRFFRLQTWGHSE